MKVWAAKVPGRVFLAAAGFGLGLGWELALAGTAAADPIRVDVDTVAVVQLDGAAGTVYLANPAIADITPVASNKLFVLGKRPGQSNLVVLDADGRELLNTPIVVRPQETNAVTVTRGTQETTLTCNPRCVDLGPTQGGAQGGK